MFRPLVPWRERATRPLVRLEREMEDLWDRFFGREGEWEGNIATFAPQVDVAETADKFEVKVDLPGMKPEDFNVELSDGGLLISGKKEEEHEEKDTTYHRIERRYGEFRRFVPLPGKVTEKDVKAEYHDGVLMVSVPKSEEAKPHRIEVKA